MRRVFVWRTLPSGRRFKLYLPRKWVCPPPHECESGFCRTCGEDHSEGEAFAAIALRLSNV